MQEYITMWQNMWKNYANFSDRTTVRGYWMAVLIQVIAGFVIGTIAGILGLFFISSLFALASAVPTTAMLVRRLRDMGKEWTYIFIGLIPIAGIILLIIAACQPSAPADDVPVV